MSNSTYVSPRLYSSKYKNKKTKFDLGVGYVIPHGISKSDFRKTYTEWERKLAASGFEDIEYRAPAQTGNFSSFFRKNGSTATFQTIYDPSTEEYFYLARSFEAYMNQKPRGSKTSRWYLFFPNEARVYKTLWYLHIEGVPYRAIAKAFSGEPSKWTKELRKVSKSLVGSRSVFWAHTHMQMVLNLFWKWAKVQGLSDPRSERSKSITFENPTIPKSNTSNDK